MALTEQQLWRQLATGFKGRPSAMGVRGGPEGPVQRQQLSRGDSETSEWVVDQKAAGLVWTVRRHLRSRGGRDMAAPAAEGDLGRGTLPAAEGGRSKAT